MTFKTKRLVNVDSERAVSSVVEHYLDTVGVAGSNPAPRTILLNFCSRGSHPACWLQPKPAAKLTNARSHK